MIDAIDTYSLSEAKNLGSEIVEDFHVFLAATKLLQARDLLDGNDKAIILAGNIRQRQSENLSSGFKTPEFSNSALTLMKSLTSIDDLIDFVQNFDFSQTSHSIEDKNSQNRPTSGNDPSQRVVGFHAVEGPNLSRLPTYMPQKDYSSIVINQYLLNGESYIWDGVYNSKGYPISTRQSTQSMGRLFVTNLRLIFWSDDFDKPHLAVFYRDIESWKTNWLPMKSRGVAMVVSRNKVLFAANSTAIDLATKEYSRTQK